MPVRRALVECTVLALQDSCVFYPSCKGCFSRIHTDSGENSEDPRLTCSRCGSSCSRSLLDYRYRLSVRVARGSCMFGVTVFGTCLNQFFGIGASGLQRLVADTSGPLESSRPTLLLKAVEECFIGKYFIFGIKVTDNDPQPWLEDAEGNSSMSQIIATQMILPEAPGLRGCTVLSCFEAALQKDAESTHCTVSPIETAKPDREPRFSNDTLQSSGFFPQPLSGSLSLTPPWQQTPGLITSSAEQEELTQDDTKSPRFSGKHRRSTTPLKAWPGLTPAAHKTAGLLALQVNDLSTSAFTRSILTACPAQDEFPLSESLMEFLDRSKLDHSQQKILLESTRDPVDFTDRRQVCDGNNERKTAGNCDTNEASGDEQAESSVYNCSADLFSNSPRMDVNTQSFVDTSSLTSTEKENDQKLSKCNLRESFRLSANFDFIPPSQSTPAVQKGKSLQSTKENVNWRNQTTPKSRCKTQHGLRKKHLSARRGVLNSAVYKRKTKDDALIVPPTPAHLRKKTLFKSYKERTLNSASKKDHFQTESCSKSSECGFAHESECKDAEEEEGDWSRDLFSDSL